MLKSAWYEVVAGAKETNSNVYKRTRRDERCEHKEGASGNMGGG